MRRPPTIFSRPTYEWINRVNQAHSKFAALKPSPDQEQRLKQWIDAQFVISALKLEGMDVSADRVSKIAARRESDLIEPDENDSWITGAINALRLIEAAARSEGRQAPLTLKLVLGLGMPSGSGFRKWSGVGAQTPGPVPPKHILTSVESACRWFTAESFAELNPVEQASIAYLRMTEIHPFEQGNTTSALAVASLFTLRAMLPPIIFPPEKITAYHAALDEGLQANTKPMVELIAESIEQTLTAMANRLGG
jgi:Fic/DOC family protein